MPVTQGAIAVAAPAPVISAAATPEAALESLEDAAAPTAVSPEGGAPDEGFVWPEGTIAAPASGGEGEVARDVDDQAPLPALDDLVQKLPADTRDVLDELFRAKFVAVRRVPKAALKGL